MHLYPCECDVMCAMTKINDIQGLLNKQQVTFSVREEVAIQLCVTTCTTYATGVAKICHIRICMYTMVFNHQSVAPSIK